MVGLFWTLGWALIKTIFSKDEPDPRVIGDYGGAQGRSSFAQTKPYPNVHQILNAEPQRRQVSPARQEEIDRYWADQRARGLTTLCCDWADCFCGQNIRLVNGVPMRCFGTTLPGSDYDQWKKSTGGGYSLLKADEHHAERANMNETTMPLPRIVP